MTTYEIRTADWDDFAAQVSEATASGAVVTVVTGPDTAGHFVATVVGAPNSLVGEVQVAEEPPEEPAAPVEEPPAGTQESAELTTEERLAALQADSQGSGG